MASQLTVLKDVEGADNLSALEPGDEFRFVVTGTVSANDGGDVTIDVSGVEAVEGEDVEDGEYEEDGGEMPMHKGGKTPIAIIAIGGGPKK